MDDTLKAIALIVGITAVCGGISKCTYEAHEAASPGYHENQAEPDGPFGNRL